MNKFVSVIIGDEEWLGIRVDERVILLYPSCKVGQCRRPGARLLGV